MRWALLTVRFGLVAFLVATLLHGTGLAQPWDRAASAYALDHAPALLVAASAALGALGSLAFLGPLLVGCAAGLVLARRHRAAWTLLATFAAGDLAVLALKWLFARPRPATALVEADGFAFPSGHAARAALLAVIALAALAGAQRRRAWHPWAAGGVVLAAVAMAASRVILQVHHVVDVAAGAALGAAMGALGLLVAAAVAPAGDSETDAEAEPGEDLTLSLPP